MRILVAHFVSAVRTGGMSRLVGTVHDRLAAERDDLVHHFLTRRLIGGVTFERRPEVVDDHLGTLGRERQ